MIEPLLASGGVGGHAFCGADLHVDLGHRHLVFVELAKRRKIVKVAAAARWKKR
jgi:hypothetical protein